MLRSRALPGTIAAIAFAASVVAGPVPASGQAAKKSPPIKPAPAERESLRAKIRSLAGSLDRIGKASPDLQADVRVFHRAASLMDELDEYARADDTELLSRLLSDGETRAAALARGEAPWTGASGSVLRGYVSTGRRDRAALLGRGTCRFRSEEGGAPRRRPSRPQRRHERGPVPQRTPGEESARRSHAPDPPRLRPREQCLPLGGRNGRARGDRCRQAELRGR